MKFFSQSPQILKLTPISICPLKNMGKNLQNGHIRYLRNCPNASLLHYFSEWTRKMGKMGSFRISIMQKFLRGIQGCNWKADVQCVLKMWCYFMLSVFELELWLLKVNRVWNFSNVSKNKMRHKKLTLSSHCKLSIEMNITSSQPY